MGQTVREQKIWVCLLRLLLIALLGTEGHAALAEPESGRKSDQACDLSASMTSLLRQAVELTRVDRVDRPLLGVYSPNGAYQYWLASPGRREAPPFESFIEIDSEGADLQCIRLPGVRDSISARWINEKLIYAEWISPQSFSAELLHDVESGAFVQLRSNCTD